MSRSIWKGPIFNKRSSTIIPEFIGKIIPVHDGSTFKPLLINTESVGLKLGQLVYTKKVPIFKK